MGIMRDQTHLHGLTDVLYSPGNAVSKELHCSIITITFPWEPLSKKGSLPIWAFCGTKDDKFKVLLCSL